MWPFKRRHDEDFHREIEAHLDLDIDRLIADGMSPGEARHAAMRAFGTIARTRERHYESRRVVWLHVYDSHPDTPLPRWRCTSASTPCASPSS